MVLLERMRLPATAREELLGMMRLQLEKTLPFFAEKTSGDMEIISQSGTESWVLALSVYHEQLENFSAVMRARQLVPEKVSLFAIHLAGTGKPAETDCIIYAEDDKIAFAICENGKLSYAQTLSSTGPEDFCEQLPSVLLSAELEEAPVTFATVRLDDSLADWEPKVREFFQVPVQKISSASARMESNENLLPSTWRSERSKIARASVLRERLIFAGIGYVALVVLAVATIFWLRFRLGKIEEQVRTTRPQIDAIAMDKARWLALAPAIDPQRYPLEILWQVCAGLSSDDIRLTKFNATTTQFLIEAEAPTASAAVAFGERLKKSPGLNEFALQNSPPAILSNEHAQLRLTGKL